MSTPASFRAVRWIRTLNLLAQAVLFVTLFAGLNYLAGYHPWRFDLTASHRNSLSPETFGYLRQLDAPVRVVVTLDPDSGNDEIAQAYRDVTDLLREYAYATEKNPRGRVKIEYLNIYQRSREAAVLGITNPNTIVVQCEGRSRLVPLDKLYDVQDQQKKAFLGEKVFTAAILDVANPVRKKIYFLTGHGEMQVDDTSPARGLSLLSGELRARNFDVESLDLSASGKVPDDAAVVVIAGPQGSCTSEEQSMLRQYLSNHAGRLIALIPPMYPSGLGDLFYEWGLLADDDIIYDNGSTDENENGDLILNPTADGAAHPVTAKLAAYHIPLRFGLSRSIRPDPGRPLDNTLVVTALVSVTSATAWGECNYRNRSGPPRFDANIDLPASVLDVVTASERVTAQDNLPFSVPGGRVVAVGSADWVSNARLGVIGNLTLFMSAIDWATDRDSDLGIPVRPINKFQLSLTDAQLRNLRYSLFLLLPGVAALLGLIVYWTRRS